MTLFIVTWAWSLHRKPSSPWATQCGHVSFHAWRLDPHYFTASSVQTGYSSFKYEQKCIIQDWINGSKKTLGTYSIRWRTKMVESNQIPGSDDGLHPIVRVKKTSERRPLLCLLPLYCLYGIVQKQLTINLTKIQSSYECILNQKPASSITAYTMYNLEISLHNSGRDRGGVTLYKAHTFQLCANIPHVN